jgi:hypothetical protein
MPTAFRLSSYRRAGWVLLAELGPHCHGVRPQPGGCDAPGASRSNGCLLRPRAQVEAVRGRQGLPGHSMSNCVRDAGRRPVSVKRQRAD